MRAFSCRRYVDMFASRRECVMVLAECALQLSALAGSRVKGKLRRLAALVNERLVSNHRVKRLREWKRLTSDSALS